MRTLFWECTPRCNASCLHCGSDCHVSSAHPDMPVEDFLKVIDEITPHVDPHKVMITFTGGEALVRKDIEACGRELNKREYPWGIVSNGLLLNRTRLDSLLAAGMHSITISLDGFEEAHNWLRETAGASEGAVNAIAMLAEEKEIVWDVVDLRQSEKLQGPDAVQGFSDRAGSQELAYLPPFFLWAGRQRHRNCRSTTHNSLGSLNSSVIAAPRERYMLVLPAEGFLGNYEGEVRDQIFHCNAGISTASVLIDGSISGCPSIRANFHQGNIYKDSFVDVWNNGFKEYRNREWARKGQCADCDMFRYCEGSGMHLHDDSGDLITCHYRRIEN
ncbi:MAG: TIGR04133 family radical SAM/SPASM protein [Parabacteroides merdae]